MCNGLPCIAMSNNQTCYSWVYTAHTRLLHDQKLSHVSSVHN